MSLALEKEVLRNLSGPELTMQTGLEPMMTPEMQGVVGGGPVSEGASEVLSAAASALSGAIVSGADGVPTNEESAILISAAISERVSGFLSDLIPV